MPALLRASAGYLMRRPLQLVLAVAGIAIGVAVIVATDLANQSARRAFAASMDRLNGAATHQVVGGPGGIDESVYFGLRRLPGLRQVAPVVSGYVSAGDRTLQLLGVDVFAESRFRQFTAPSNIGSDIAGGGGANADVIVRQLLTADGAVLMSPATAEALELRPGASFPIVANGRTHDAVLIALIGDRHADAADDILVADIASAQEWLGMVGRLSRIDVRLEPGEALSEADLSRYLPAGVELFTASGRTQTKADMSNAFMTNLNAMSLLALLVGLFLIYNSISFSVLQRRELIGVLRALGVTRGQVFRLILGEAAALGVVGSVLGLLLGGWLARGLLALVTRTLSDHYFAVTATAVELVPGSIAKGLLAGLGATVLAALVPAVEASNNRPKLSMTRSRLEDRAAALLPRLAIAGLATMFAASLLLAASGRSLVAGLTGLFGLIFGFGLCLPIVTAKLSATATPLADRLGGTPARLAFGGVGQSLSRTGVAVVALAVAVSTTIGVSVMVGSFRASVNDWLGNTLQSDVYVGVPGGTMESSLIDDIRTLPGVEAVSTSRRAWIESRHGRTRLVAVDMPPGAHAGTRLRHPDPAAAWRRFDEGLAVLVSDSYAYRNGVSRGDSISLDTPAGMMSLEVASVYQSYDANDGAIVMSRRTYDSLYGDAGIDSVGLFLGEAVDPETVMAAIRQLSEGRQVLVMNSNARIRDLSLAVFDRTFLITNVLYWIAVGVAIIGILGAMLALQLERKRELGILRAIGMTPAETGGLVMLQSGFLGAIAGLASMPLGLGMAWILVKVINRRAFGWQIDFHVAAEPLAAALLLAVSAALAGGLYPAWRAAKTRPALAIRDE